VVPRGGLAALEGVLKKTTEKKKGKGSGGKKSFPVLEGEWYSVNEPVMMTKRKPQGGKLAKRQRGENLDCNVKQSARERGFFDYEKAQKEFGESGRGDGGGTHNSGIGSKGK